MANLPRSIGNNRNQEGDGRSPIDAVPIPVSGMSPVERGYVNMSSLDEPIIASHDGSDWSKEDSKASHERQ